MHFGLRRKDSRAEAVAVAAGAAVAVVEVAVGDPAAAEAHGLAVEAAHGPAGECLAQAAACRGQAVACPDQVVLVAVRVPPLAEAALGQEAEFPLAAERHRLVRPVAAPVRLNSRPIVPD